MRPARRELFGDIMSGATKLKAITSLVISTVVTVAVVAPLLWRATQLESRAVVPADRIVVTTPELDAEELDGATVAGPARIALQGEEIQAVAFVVAPRGAASIIERVDGDGPNFDLFTDDAGSPLPLDTTKLDDGDYDLLLTVTSTDGSVAKAAAGFEIRNGES